MGSKDYKWELDSGAGKMAHSVKYLLGKRKKLNSCPNTHVESHAPWNMAAIRAGEVETGPYLRLAGRLVYPDQRAPGSVREPKSLSDH